MIHARLVSRGFLFAAAGLLALAALATSGPAAAKDAKDAKSDGDHLRWRRTYREALLEARIRNLPVLVTRHKDECGRCERMYRAVLTNKDFVRWANEHVVLLVAHNEMLHDEDEVKGAGGDVTKECSIYPGLRCRDHVDAAVDIDNARGEDLIAVPFLELCPNTWLVAPTGEVTQVAEEEQFVAGKVRERIEALQKTLGAPQSEKAWPALRDLVAKADVALDAESWKDALTHLAALEAKVKPLHASLKALIQARLDAVEEHVATLFEDLRDDGKLPASDKRDRIQRLRADVDVAVLGGKVPSHAAMTDWLAH